MQFLGKSRHFSVWFQGEMISERTTGDVTEVKINL